MPGFTPGGMIATAAHAAAVGVRRSSPRRRTRSRKRKVSKGGKRSRRSRRGGSRKPRPGTKAWMAYIRGMKGKKKRK